MFLIHYVYFSLPEKVLDMIRSESLTQGHAKILIGLENALLLSKKNN